ncbi:hypothetical protein KY334_08240 [Candidatus Woesearchaeota archaeon]|nr:hypothetical protein [Candidatus Woesearchaeota archaeon]
MDKKCEHKNCTRKAVTSNSQYFEGIWYCTFHANRYIKEGRIKRKYEERKECIKKEN